MSVCFRRTRARDLGPWTSFPAKFPAQLGPAHFAQLVGGFMQGSAR